MVQYSPLILTLEGDFDVYSGAQLTELIAPAERHKHVILDCTRVRYIDSTCIGVLIRMRKRRAASGFPPARFVGLNRSLRKVFEIARLDSIWPTFETIEEATASFSEPA